MSSTFVSSFSCVDSDASDRVLYFFRCFTFLLQRIPSGLSTVVQLPVLLLTVYGFVWNGVVNLLWYGCFIRTLSPMHISASAARLLSSAYSFPINSFNRSSSRMLSSSGTEGRSYGSFVLNFLPYNASAGDIPNVESGVVLYANRYVRSSSFQFCPSPLSYP